MQRSQLTVHNGGDRFNTSKSYLTESYYIIIMSMLPDVSDNVLWQFWEQVLNEAVFIHAIQVVRHFFFFFFLPLLDSYQPWP